MEAIPAWQAGTISPEDREILFKETESFHALERAMRRRVGMAGWIVGGVGAAIALMSITAILVLLPLKQTTVKFVEVDTSTGWVGEAAGAMDAPKMFTDRVAAHYLRAYIEAREGYLPDRDQAQWEAVRALSSADEMQNYIAWRKTDLAPVKQFGSIGRVDVFNFNPSRPITGKNGTISYVVRFDRREIKGQAVGPIRHWKATIDFQWHPEMTMTTGDSQINEAGMQVMAYKSEEE